MHPCQVLTADIRAQVGFVKAFSAEDISRRPLAMTPSESMKGWLKMSWRLRSYMYDLLTSPPELRNHSVRQRTKRRSRVSDRQSR